MTHYRSIGTIFFNEEEIGVRISLGVVILRELQKVQDTLSKDLQDTILALLDEAKDVVVPEEVLALPQAQEPAIYLDRRK